MPGCHNMTQTNGKNVPLCVLQLQQRPELLGNIFWSQQVYNKSCEKMCRNRSTFWKEAIVNLGPICRTECYPQITLFYTCFWCCLFVWKRSLATTQFVSRTGTKCQLKGSHRDQRAGLKIHCFSSVCCSCKVPDFTTIVPNWSSLSSILHTRSH